MLHPCTPKWLENPAFSQHFALQERNPFLQGSRGIIPAYLFLNQPERDVGVSDDISWWCPGRKTQLGRIQPLWQWGNTLCPRGERLLRGSPRDEVPLSSLTRLLVPAGGSLARGAAGDPELYVRWLQIVTFLPVMAFSTPPWLCCDAWVRTPVPRRGGPGPCTLSAEFLLQNRCACGFVLRGSCSHGAGTHEARGKDDHRHVPLPLFSCWSC